MTTYFPVLSFQLIAEVLINLFKNNLAKDNVFSLICFQNIPSVTYGSTSNSNSLTGFVQNICSPVMYIQLILRLSCIS